MSHYDDDGYYDPLAVQQWLDYQFRGTDTTVTDLSIDDMIAFPFQKEIKGADGRDSALSGPVHGEFGGAEAGFGAPGGFGTTGVSFGHSSSPTLSTSSSRISLTPNITNETNESRFVHRHLQSVPIDKMTLLSLGLGLLLLFESPSPVYEQELMDDLASLVATIKDSAGGTVNPKELEVNLAPTSANDVNQNHGQISPQSQGQSQVANTGQSNLSFQSNEANHNQRSQLQQTHGSKDSASISPQRLFADQIVSPPKLSNQSVPQTLFTKPELDFKLSECYSAISQWEQNDSAVDDVADVGDIEFSFDGKPRSQSYSYDSRKRNTRLFNVNVPDVPVDILSGILGDKKRRKSMKDEVPFKIKNRSRSGLTSLVRNRSNSVSKKEVRNNSVHKVDLPGGLSPPKTLHAGVDGSFQCSECDKSFKRSEHLKRHIRSVHLKERPYACEFCDKRFLRTDNLAQHSKTHKKDVGRRSK